MQILSKNELRKMKWKGKKQQSREFIPKPTILIEFVPCTRSMDI